jgi:hypothetical protein
MVLPGELVEQRRGVIPRRVRVVAQACKRQSIKWLRRVRRRGGDVRVRAPRARRTSPEGAFRPVALVGQGATRAVIVLCVRLGSWVSAFSTK